MIEPRVVLLSPFWSFWADRARFDLRADRAQLAGEIERALTGCRVLAAESYDSPDSARRVVEHIGREQVDVLLVIQSMAVPPSYTTALIDAFPEVAVVVWAVQRERRLPDSFDHADVTAGGATVGTSQLAGALARRGRTWNAVVGPLGDDATHESLGRTLVAAAVSTRLRRARIGLVGEPQDGYECVECDSDALTAATGMVVVRIQPDAFRAGYVDASDDQVTAIELEMRTAFELDPQVEHDSAFVRSVRCAVALAELGRRERLDAGAINCHVPEIRFAAEPGIAPCLALGRETSRGVPWTCTGDVPTAIAMLTAKWLGSATLYHELESIDYATDELAIANTGEHDLAWSEGRPRLVPNEWFAGDLHRGLCACYALRRGSATLVAFTPHPQEPSGFRYIVAEGEITGRSFPRTGTPNGAFRFTGLTAADGYRQWALSGASHHSCLGTGLLGDDIALVASHLGVGCVRVSPRVGAGTSA